MNRSANYLKSFSFALVLPTEFEKPYSNTRIDPSIRQVFFSPQNTSEKVSSYIQGLHEERKQMVAENHFAFLYKVILYHCM